MLLAGPARAAPTVGAAKPGRVSPKKRSALGAPDPAKMKLGKGLPSSALKDKYLLNRHVVWVQIVRLADDDGGRASAISETAARNSIKRMNEIWSRNDGKIVFKLHPASNFDDHIKSTLLNSDCLLQRGYTPDNISNVTNPDLNGDGEGGKLEDMDVLCDTTRSIVARTSYAARRQDRVTVLSRGGRFRVRYNAGEGNWQYYKVANSAGHKGLYVNLAETTNGDVLGHELGHFLHLAHTFGVGPKHMAEANAIMGKWASGHPGEPPARVFDGDRRAALAADGIQIFDTPPDPGARLWKAVFGDVCKPTASSLTLYPKINGQTKAVAVAPDRGNLMSYFGKCAGIERHLSLGQLAMSTKALESGNRTELLATKGKSKCYDQGYAPGVLAQDREQLAAILADVAQCRLSETIASYGSPWFGEVYRAASPRMPRGFSKRGQLGVHRAREREMIDALIRTPLLQ